MLKTHTFYMHEDAFITLSPKCLTDFINKFWSEVFNVLENKLDIHLLLMIKVKFDNGEYRSLGELRKTNFDDRDSFTNFIVNRLSILSDTYTSSPVDQIIFTYMIRKGEAGGDRALNRSDKYEVGQHVYNNYQLPLTMDIKGYGKILGKMYLFLLYNASSYLYGGHGSNAKALIYVGPC